MAESFVEIFDAESTHVEIGSIISGEVMDIHNEHVTISASLKSEGIVPIEQFKDRNGEIEVKEGDIVEVVLDAIEDGYGVTRLSREKAKRMRMWEVLEQAYETSSIIQGVISGKVKGGFIVDLGGISAFLPGSLVDVRPVKDTAYLEGKELEFKVIKLDYERNNAIISRRAVVESEYNSEREELLKKLEKDCIVKGIVKNLTDYGAFIDLGGLDGLLHITDISWKRIRHPSEVVEIGDEIEVKVLEYDKERMRVSLGLKQLGEDPWTDIKTQYPPGTKTFGKVTNVAEYGCFVEIQEGAEGLVHVSEMDWCNKNIHPSKVVSLGEEIEVMVLDIDHERRRISLGIKQCQPNPWQKFSEKYKKGDRIEGVVKLITDFGIFVGIESFGIDGLVHISDLSWVQRGKTVIHEYAKGDKVLTVILGINVENGRISLGIKQLENNAVSEYLNQYTKNSIVKGTIKEVRDDSFGVGLNEVVVGTLPFANLADEGDKNKITVGDEIEAKLINIDKNTNSLILSVKAKEEDEEKDVIEDYTASGIATASIGEKVRDKQGDA